jgi:hypothetical protein
VLSAQGRALLAWPNSYFGPTGPHRLARGRQRGGAGQGGGGRGSPEKDVNGEVAVHGLAAAVRRREAGAVVEGGGGRVLQHQKV